MKVSGAIGGAVAVLFAMGVQASIAQDVTISGHVTDRLTGAPISNAYIEVLGTNYSSGGWAATDGNGAYAVVIASGLGHECAIVVSKQAGWDVTNEEAYFATHEPPFLLDMTLITKDFTLRSGGYEVTHLGAFPKYVDGHMNNKGEVLVSYRDDITSLYRTFLWKDGIWTELNAFQGLSSVGDDINDLSEVSATAYVQSNLLHAVLFDENGIPMDLGSPTNNADRSYGRTLNNNGQVVGVWQPGSYSWQNDGFIWQNAGMMPLGLDSYVPGWLDNADVGSINNRGETVGFSVYYDGSNSITELFRWHDGVVTRTNFANVQYPYYDVMGINEAGTVAGNDNDVGAFLWNDAGLQTLPLYRPRNSYISTWVYDINESGDVLGHSEWNFLLWKKNETIPVYFSVLADTNGYPPSVEPIDVNDHGVLLSSDYYYGVSIMTPVYYGNQPPKAYEQSLSTSKDTALNVTLTSSDGDSEPVTYEIVTPPANGSLSGTVPNLSYTPASGYTGPDSFTFKVNDGTEDSHVAAISIRVAGNIRPVVTAGQDVYVTNTEWGVGAYLNGSAGDDGLPFGSFTTTWSMVSGPGNANISKPHALDTYVNGLTNGIYVFRLTADDGEYTRSDTTMLHVEEKPNEAPWVDIYSDVTITLPDNDTFLWGSVYDDGLPTNGTLAILWSQLSGPGPVTFDTPTMDYTLATFPAEGVYVIQLFADDGELTASDTMTVTVLPENLPPAVNAGPDQTIRLPDVAILDGTVTDDGLPSGYLNIHWHKVVGPGIVTFSDENAEDTTASFSAPGTYGLDLHAFDGATNVSDLVAITVLPANVAPTVDAGADQTVTLPSGVSLDGAITDDGVPSNSVSATWSKQSGPGSVTFGNANTEDTTASFSTDGIYVLRLLADDGELSASDTVTITVNPIPNQAPTVDAGDDFSQKFRRKKWYPLNGSVTDDGLPNPPGSTAVTWSKVSGPGSVTFSNVNAVDTTAKFSKRGTYVLKLRADDGEFATEDTITITLTRR